MVTSRCDFVTCVCVGLTGRVLPCYLKGGRVVHQDTGRRGSGERSLLIVSPGGRVFVGVKVCVTPTLFNVHTLTLLLI